MDSRNKRAWVIFFVLYVIAIVIGVVVEAALHQ